VEGGTDVLSVLRIFEDGWWVVRESTYWNSGNLRLLLDVVV
jgi:hypothetical protein